MVFALEPQGREKQPNHAAVTVKDKATGMPMSNRTVHVTGRVLDNYLAIFELE